MKKLMVVLTIILISIASTKFCLANEQKNHICFRIVDSNHDGEVTFEEFKKFFGNDYEKFQEADMDNNNNLSHDEYHELLGHGP